MLLRRSRGQGLPSTARASGGIGRRAGFRFLCPQGRGGSSPPSPTHHMTRPSTPDPALLRAPRLLDGSGTPPVGDAALLVEDGRIAYAGPAAGLPAGADRLSAVDFSGA